MSNAGRAAACGQLTPRKTDNSLFFVDGQTFMSRTTPASRVWHPLSLVTLLAIWLATLGNWPLWQALWRLPELQASPWRTMLANAALLLGFNLVFLGLTLWGPWRRVLGLVFLAASATATYFMLAYGVVIDPSMVANALHTDAREVRDLLSLEMFWPALWGFALPGIWWWRQSARQQPWRRAAWQRLAFLAFALVLTALIGRFAFQDLASTMRNNKSLRYMINPYNGVYALVHLGVGRAADVQRPLQAIGLDARFTGRVAASPQQGPLILLVVGETLRADHVGLGGYARDTSPELMALKRRGELVYFDQVSSCGTNTQVSLPCMFSSLGHEGLDVSRNLENLLDVLKHAGLAVTWLDDQSGCKGVCERVPNINTSALNDASLCPDGECFDEILVKQLPQQLAKLDAQAQARATLAVLHMMGSHGPAYFKRVPQAQKKFLPECTDQALQNCDLAAVVNAYDNTARYTDHVLAEMIGWLKTQSPSRPTALLFVSDHGESLGENGLFLHGMPYAIAPREQTHVPMLAWLSPSWQSQLGLPLDCLQKKASLPYSHDNLFHTVLGLAQVNTELYRPELDITSACRAPG